jgi:hypothetical protein
LNSADHCVHPRAGRTIDGAQTSSSRCAFADVARKRGVDRAKGINFWFKKAIPESVASDVEIAPWPSRHDANILWRALSAFRAVICASWCWSINAWRTPRSKPELKLDDAEANLCEALHCDDPRRRDAASSFMLRNVQRAAKRGYAVAASAVSLEVNAEPARPVHYVVSWGKPDDDEEPDRELDPGEYRRDGRIFQTPRYGVGGDQRDDDGVVDGELSPSATLIEHEAEAVIEAIEPEPPSPPTPTPAHIELLRLRPDKADAFDAKFGVGAAAKILGR